MKFTVCVLLYGDHAELANRVLASLARPAWQDKFQLRIGRNDLSKESLRVARSYGQAVRENTIYYDGVAPFYKYPLMRKMLHVPEINTPYVMWFDDDSWVKESAPDDWFDRVEDHLVTKQLDVIGAPYFVHLRGNQHLWITDQPWFAGKEVRPRQRIDFITGGWLAMRTSIIQTFDWPPEAILHNGGDVMLGAMCHQQGLKIGKFTDHVAINANQSGKCSTATRRGASLSPIGVDYDPRNVPAPEEPKEQVDWMSLFDGRSL